MQQNKKLNGIEIIIDMMSQDRLVINDKKIIKQMQPTIKNIIRKYEEEYNDASNEDTIEKDISTKKVEEILDKKIPCYMKYNDQNPMKGISWHGSKKIYQVRFEDIHTSSANLDTACDKIIDHFILKNGEKIFRGEEQKYFALSRPLLYMLLARQYCIF